MKKLIQINKHQEIIKKSTFVAIVGSIKTTDNAIEFLNKYSITDATHNCWAYKIGSLYRFNDDGEPSGTAGMPILKAIENQDYDNTIALVIRYYGGIKLGTGGLMRAYGGSVNRCLQASEHETIQDLVKCRLAIPFQHVQSVHNEVKKIDGNILEETFTEFGAELTIELLAQNYDKFIKNTINLSKGKIQELKEDD